MIIFAKLRARLQLYNITNHDHYDLGGSSFIISKSFDAKTYRTTSYGLRVGSDSFMVDLKYLTINDLVTYDKDIDGYVDYRYPYGLKGFPSVTFNFFIERDESYSFGWFLHFGTLSQYGQPFIPDIGFIVSGNEGAGFFSWTPPATFSMSMRFIN